jgi:hypothetical protein
MDSAKAIYRPIRAVLVTRRSDRCHGCAVRRRILCLSSCKLSHQVNRFFGVP